MVFMPACRLVLKGRISFYDQYGVIRDVLQNHLTEVMTLLTMKLPVNISNSEEVLHNKLQVFRFLLPLGKDQAVIGQYQAYKSEVQKELNKTKDHASFTPTFAGDYSAHSLLFSCTKIRHNCDTYMDPRIENQGTHTIFF